MQSNICYKCQREIFEWETYITNQEEFNLTNSIELIKTRAIYNGSNFIINLPESEALNSQVPEWKQVVLSKHNFIFGKHPERGTVCYYHDGNIITLIN